MLSRLVNGEQYTHILTLRVLLAMFKFTWQTDAKVRNNNGLTQRFYQFSGKWVEYVYYDVGHKLGSNKLNKGFKSI